MTRMPAGLPLRAPTHDDLPAIAELAERADRHDVGAPDFTLEDLRDEWRAPGFEPRTDAWLVEESGCAVAYVGIARRGDHADCFGWVDPAYRRRGVGSSLVAMTEERAADMAASATEGGPVLLDHWALHADPDHAKLLETHGYRLVRSFWRMAIDLDVPPATPRPVPGTVIRGFRLNHDERPLHAALQEAFADHWEFRPTPFEDWWGRRSASERFDPKLWFVAESAGEEPPICGAALCDLRGTEGHVATLGVRRAWRGRGLGQALLRHAFAVLFERGARRAILEVDADSPTGATRLYERAGMHVIRQYDCWRKSIAPRSAADAAPRREPE